MKFGIFDHIDKSNLTLCDQLDDRLEYVKAAEDAHGWISILIKN